MSINHTQLNHYNTNRSRFQISKLPVHPSMETDKDKGSHQVPIPNSASGHSSYKQEKEVKVHLGKTEYKSMLINELQKLNSVIFEEQGTINLQMYPSAILMITNQ